MLGNLELIQVSGSESNVDSHLRARNKVNSHEGPGILS